jgi:hypothetical protein
MEHDPVTLQISVSCDTKSERYLHHKNLEILAMAAPETHPMLKVNILCCGLRYGMQRALFMIISKKLAYNHPNFYICLEQVTI